MTSRKRLRVIRLGAWAMGLSVLAGCYEVQRYRNTPAEQVEDFAICKAGGMSAFQTIYGEVMCEPPSAEP